MKWEYLELILEGYGKVQCIKAGNGSKIAFICGPGSFYMQSLSFMENEYTFITCDSEWTYKKVSETKEKDFSLWTKENIIKRDFLLVEEIKKKFNVDKIDAIGLSAPGMLLLEELMLCPNNFDSVIIIGGGLGELDPLFKKNNLFFSQNATPDRKEVFYELQNKHTVFTSHVASGNFVDEPLFKFFSVKQNVKSTSKPHRRFISETISFAPKIFFDFLDMEKNKATILQHWAHNICGYHLDKFMQEHFFSKIYPEMNSLNTLLELERRKINVLLVYGNNDFITPLSEDVRNMLKDNNFVKFEVIDNCGHMPYIEKQKELEKIIFDFINLRNASPRVFPF